MTIYFANTTPIDFAAIELMGVSVKTGPSAIGFFGTGLKFAIACALRNGCKVSAWIAGEPWDFTLTLETIREKEFDRVVMRNPSTGALRPLGFTTELGKHWHLWQAFREFESNCRDEDGLSGPPSSEFPFLDAEYNTKWGTIFAITSPAFDECWATRDQVFLPSKPLYTYEGIVEIHPLGADPHAVFCKGVLAGRLDKPGMFTYNSLNGTLTEDRTLNNLYLLGADAGRAFCAMAPENVIASVITARDGNWESDWYNWPSWDMNLYPKFEAAVEQNLRNPKLNRHAKSIFLSNGDNETKQFTRVEWNAERLATAVEALALLRRLGPNMNIEDFAVVDGLGPSVFGMVRKGKIYIARQTFDMGHRYLASTLFEEWLHKEQGLEDCSRELQNFLFERLATITERVMELEALAGPEDTIALRELPQTKPERTEALRADDIPF